MAVATVKKMRTQPGLPTGCALNPADSNSLAVR
jgi:hypothetical protein